MVAARAGQLFDKAFHAELGEVVSKRGQAVLLGGGAQGDLLACKDIGRENDSMLSLTLIFRRDGHQAATDVRAPGRRILSRRGCAPGTTTICGHSMPEPARPQNSNFAAATCSR